MLKPMLKLIRNEGRGLKAPALVARPNLLTRLVRSTRGYAFLGASVSVAAVVVVSLLTWLSGYVDNAVGRPTEVIERVLPGMLEQVDDQLATLIGAEDEETLQGAVLRSTRDGLAAVSSAIPWPGTPREAAAANRSTNATGNLPPSSGPTTSPRSNAATPAPGSDSPTTNEPSPKTTTGETPSSAGASEEPPSATQEPSSPEPPSPEPPPREPSPETPLPETPPQETPPPITEEPPPTVPPAPPGEVPVPPPVTEAPPPVTEVPPPITETPPPVASEPPPVADQPPPMPEDV